MWTTLLILASLALVAEAQINFGKSSASASFQGSVSSSANSRGSSSTSLTFGSSLSSQGRGFARVEGQQAASNSFSSNNGGRFGGESSLVASFTSSCLPLSKCSSVLFSSREFSASSCKLTDGSAGTLCSHRTFQAASRRPFRSAETSTFIATRNSAGSIDLALRSGQSAVRNMTRFSTSQFASPRRGTGTFYHARFQRQSRPRVLAKVGRAGLLAAQAALQLSRSDVSVRRGGGAGLNGLNGGAVNFGASSASRQVLSTGPTSCAAPSTCSGSGLYRRADGSCNNLAEPRFGQSDTPLNRILLPDYADGVSAPRMSISGSSLPSARFVSTRLTRDLDNPDQRSSLLVMSFGQFVDHDLTHSPILKNGAGKDIDCCSSRAGTDFESFCAPIDVPPNDPFFGGRKSCMNLVRSTPAPALDCSVRYREQVEPRYTHIYISYFSSYCLFVFLSFRLFASVLFKAFPN